MKIKLLGGALLGIALGFGIGAESGESSKSVGSVGWFGLGVSEAQAGRRGRARRSTRRVARRTARRTTRRVARRTSIAGCAVWRTYWNCGGVYYAAAVEDGATVYVVVNP
jgi:hypothetical protein